MDWNAYTNESRVVIDDISNNDYEYKLINAIEIITTSLIDGGSLLVCGNGGSASDAMHITGELVGKFLIERKALRAICLSSNPSILTAWSNDYSYDSVFERQVEAYGDKHSVLFCISTSGTSKNVVSAAKRAKEINMKVISLTGEGGGDLREYSDCLLATPSRSTPIIQQAHIVTYHFICMEIEKRHKDIP